MKWISVKDKIPPAFEPIIAVHRWGHGELQSMFGQCDDDSFFFYWKDGRNYKILYIENLTHWMPMPKPPKDDK